MSDWAVFVLFCHQNRQVSPSWRFASFQLSWLWKKKKNGKKKNRASALTSFFFFFLSLSVLFNGDTQHCCEVLHGSAAVNQWFDHLHGRFCLCRVSLWFLVCCCRCFSEGEGAPTVVACRWRLAVWCEIFLWNSKNTCKFKISTVRVFFSFDTWDV